MVKCKLVDYCIDLIKNGDIPIQSNNDDIQALPKYGFHLTNFSLCSVEFPGGLCGLEFPGGLCAVEFPGGLCNF